MSEINADAIAAIRAALDRVIEDYDLGAINEGTTRHVREALTASNVLKLLRAYDELSAPAVAEPVVWQQTTADGEPLWDYDNFLSTPEHFDYSRPLYAMTNDEIDACFAAGRDAPESAKCPHHPATREAHWWTLGFAYTARLLRAIEAERDAKRYRRLGALVQFGDWGVCRGEVVDSFGRTEETHLDDKTDMDAWLDTPEVIAEAEACAIALAKRRFCGD